MKTKEQIQQELTVIKSKIKELRAELENANEAHSFDIRDIIVELDQFRATRDLLEWVLDLDSKE